MVSPVRVLVSGVAAVCLAFVLAAGTVLIQRPEPVVVEGACRPYPGGPEGPCASRPLAGGWPLAFLYDDRGTSVLNQLGFEDQFKPGRFLLDAAILGALPGVVLVGVAALGRRRRAWTAGQSSGWPSSDVSAM